MAKSLYRIHHKLILYPSLMLFSLLIFQPINENSCSDFHSLIELSTDFETQKNQEENEPFNELDDFIKNNLNKVDLKNINKIENEFMCFLPDKLYLEITNPPPEFA